jgi:RNAse (barnase) inhibitor barstar
MTYPVHFTRGEVEGTALPEGELFDALAAALRFPDYFGKNWDAVADCMTELEEPVTLVVRDAAARWKNAPDEMRMLVDIWLDAAEENEGLQLVFVW